MDNTLKKKLTDFRHLLHSEPELSGEESETAKKIADFIADYSPDRIHKHLGGNGIVATYDSGKEGPHVMIRADFDALPIEDKIDKPYKSKNKGVGHKCGHDGHSTMALGLATQLHDSPPQKGKVSILFQPAEETGQGAAAVIDDDNFKIIKPDYIFGLHNIPGIPMHQIVSSPKVFASASRGMEVILDGSNAHAGEPENGRSPAMALSHLLAYFTKIGDHEKFEEFVLATVVHTLMGEIAYGTAPGHGEIRTTLRSHLNDDMKELVKMAEQEVKEWAKKYKLDYNIDYKDIFPSTVNTEETFKQIKDGAKAASLKFKALDEPFRWSEDFGQYASIGIKSGFFGLGSGEKTPNLHHPHYDFPDELIPSGVAIFWNIIKPFCYED